MIEIIIIIVVLLLVAILLFFVCKRCMKSPPERALAMRNSLVNRNYFFQKNSSGPTNTAPYRYNNASNQIYTSTTVPFHEDFDEDSYDRRRILDEEARQRHQQVHNSWAAGNNNMSGGDGSYNSSVETHNLLSDTHDDEDNLRPSFRDLSPNDDPILSTAERTSTSKPDNSGPSMA